MSAQVTITQLPTAGPITGTELVPIVQNGVTVQATTGSISSGGAGTVTAVSVSSTNGFSGTVANPTTTPDITISTTVTGMLKGSGTGLATATANADYQSPIALTTTGSSGAATFNGTTLNIPQYSGGGSGTVTSVSVTSANGFQGSVANATTTPAITVSTNVTGILKGNGTGMSAASAGTDYQAPITLTTTGSSGAATLVGSTLNIPQYTGGGGSGTVTSVSGTGTVSGLTLSGTVTTSGDLTLGGAITGFATSGANTNISSVVLTTGTISTAPTAGNDIVNKTYADSIASGVNFHAACNYATAAALSPANTYNNGSSGVGATLTANSNGTLTVDGYTFVSGDVGKRVLIKNEASGANNGVYTLTQAGTASLPYILTRATDYDTSGAGINEIDAGDLLLVLSGTDNANTSWVQQTPLPITVGTTALVFIEFAAVQTYTAGTGLTLATNQFSITNTGTAGTYGSASQVPVLTTNAQGQVTSVTNTAIAIAGSAVSGNISGNAANVTGTVAVANGGTDLTSGTSGGVLYFSGTSALASSAALVANALVIGGGAGAAPATVTTGTGVVTALGVNTGSSGAIVTQGGAIISATTVNDSAGTGYTIGYRRMPQNNQAAAGTYTLVLADDGKHVYLTGGTTNTLTVPANASVAFPIGTVITVVNNNSGACTITGPASSLQLANGALATSRTLATKGMATMIKVGTDLWFVSGAGVT
jgi:hypothetical protein